MSTALISESIRQAIADRAYKLVGELDEDGSTETDEEWILMWAALGADVVLTARGLADRLDPVVEAEYMNLEVRMDAALDIVGIREATLARETADATDMTEGWAPALPAANRFRSGGRRSRLEYYSGRSRRSLIASRSMRARGPLVQERSSPSICSKLVQVLAQIRVQGACCGGEHP